MGVNEGHVRELAATLVQRLTGNEPADNESAIAIPLPELEAIEQLPAPLPPPVNEDNRLAIIHYVPPLTPELIALMIVLLLHMQYLPNQHSLH